MQMTVFEDIEGLSAALDNYRNQGYRIGFVPTMGALHPGHLSLMTLARTSCDVVVVSIFVNPTQFNQASDLTRYPRTIDKDLTMLREHKCDCVFVPSVAEIYPAGLFKEHWDFGLLSSSLEGSFRPGHFDGVLTVVKRLFEIVQPHEAFFGEKDFQQLTHIRRMVEAEKLDIKVVAGPTIRESDGLAMSSRNTRLSPESRLAATQLSKTLFAMRERTSEMSPPQLEQWGRGDLVIKPQIRLEYLEIIDAETFAPVADWGDSLNPVILCAAWVGEVRLIDNIILGKHKH